LDLPPEQRWVQIATDFKGTVKEDWKIPYQKCCYDWVLNNCPAKISSLPNY